MSGAEQGGRIGVLLVNLGSPDSADAAGVRRYLSEFLSDRRVIELSPLLWQPILHGIILRVRPRRKARDYAKIWNTEKNESPLKTITRAQAEALQARLPDVVVDWAMRYGTPSLRARIDALTAQGCDRILVAPLYPQYAAATTATVIDEVGRVLAGLRRQPALRVLPPYYAEPAYIAALADTVRPVLDGPAPPEVVLASFHGMPADCVAKGDPYFQHCTETMRLLRAALGLDETRLMMTFQSRFGFAEWLKPYTDETLKALAARGVRDVAVLTPGFSADCLETLEEIAVENAEVFKHAGGETFRFIPCLNDSAPGMAMLEMLVKRELAGWIAA